MTIKEQVSPEITLIDLAVPVVRDELGYWGNPAIPDFNEDAVAYKGWLNQQGIELDFARLEDENDDHPAYLKYFEDGDADVSAWDCGTPPTGGWHIFSIHDSEDGPYWVWARRAAGLDAAGVRRALENQS